MHKVQRLKNSPSELEQLKELLLADELKQLKKLEEKVNTLDFETRDESTIMKRVTPAIAKGISENKDTMIDALYPIMGGMIAKYVTQAIKEMMETINKKIEQGLSFEGVKRKAKAKITGVSETELLLEESTDAVVSAMFVIHKETSLLIAEAHLENKEIDDAHMVASMASAIKDFINDWMKHSETQNEVQLLSYGNATLYIESAGSVFIIAFLDAEPDQEQRININTFFASIVKKYASFFQSFDGDDSADEVQRLSMEMEEYIYNAQAKAKGTKKNPVKYIFLFLALLLLGYGVYLFNGWYIDHSLEEKVLSQTGEKVAISKEEKYLTVEGQVSSLNVIKKIETLLKQHSNEPLNNRLTVPMLSIDERLKNVENLGDSSLLGIEEKLTLLENDFEKNLNDLQKKIIDLEAHLRDVLQSNTDKVTALKEEKSALKKVLEVEKEIFKKLDNAFGKEEYYIAKEHALDFRKLLLFPPGRAVYHPKAMQELSSIFEKYMEILVEYKEYIDSITIEGHSDSSGIEDENIVLSEKRASSVKSYLERLNIVRQYHMKNYIIAKGYGSSQAVIVNGVEDHNASRRIKITFSLKERKILKKIGEIIND